MAHDVTAVRRVVALAAGLLLAAVVFAAPTLLSERRAVSSAEASYQADPAPAATAPAATGPATPPPATSTPRPAATSAPAKARPTARATPTPRSLDALAVASRAALGHGAGAVYLAELRPGGATLAIDADAPFVAASTWKLPLLMWEAQALASGAARPGDVLCYDPADWEDGYFEDYEPGECFTRDELTRRAGHYSDNTAAWILLRYMGGVEILNQYAAGHGARESSFATQANMTTASDLGRLLQDEYAGRAGGPAAQAWLAALLTHTNWESGIPAGVPAGTTVEHKVGMVDAEVNDAAIVTAANRPPYVLVVLTDGAGAAGWDAVAKIASAASNLEAATPLR